MLTTDTKTIKFTMTYFYEITIDAERANRFIDTMKRIKPIIFTKRQCIIEDDIRKFVLPKGDVTGSLVEFKWEDVSDA